MIPGPSTGFEVFVPGRQGIRARCDSNPACGSADLLGTPSAVFFSVTFLPVVSRRPQRGSISCRGRLQDLDAARNQDGGPGQLQPFVRPIGQCFFSGATISTVRGWASAK